jgi:hypothetical protein
MERLVLVHWKVEEVPERLSRLADAGFEAEPWAPRSAGVLSRYDRRPPDAFLIDLTRLPSHGRALGGALRRRRACRNVPLIFVGGEQDKVENVRQKLPDAIFTSWEEVSGAIQRARTYRVANPVVPDADVANPSASLTQKLAIERDMAVALLGAPPGFAAQLKPLPPGARVQTRLHTATAVALFFVRSRRDFDLESDRVATACARGCRAWVVWPKKSRAPTSGLEQKVVRAVMMERGLVDYKICSLDPTWSGMLFAVRRSSASS